MNSPGRAASRACPSPSRSRNTVFMRTAHEEHDRALGKMCCRPGYESLTRHLLLFSSWSPTQSLSSDSDKRRQMNYCLLSRACYRQQHTNMYLEIQATHFHSPTEETSPISISLRMATYSSQSMKMGRLYSHCLRDESQSTVSVSRSR